MCSQHLGSHQCCSSFISKLGTLGAPKLLPKDSSSVVGLMNSWATSFQSTIRLEEKNIIRSWACHSKIVFADCLE